LNSDIEDSSDDEQFCRYLTKPLPEEEAH